MRAALRRLMALASIVMLPIPAHAQTRLIVAVGASNTEGKNVSRPWPELLQSALRADGYNVRVLNKGVFGETTDRMVKRLDSAVPNDASLVIFQPGIINDRRAGIFGREKEMISDARSRLSQRGIKMLPLLGLKSIAGNTFVDRAHFSEAGHRRVAAYLKPRVEQMLGRP